MTWIEQVPAFNPTISIPEYVVFISQVVLESTVNVGSTSDSLSKKVVFPTFID